MNFVACRCIRTRSAGGTAGATKKVCFMLYRRRRGVL